MSPDWTRSFILCATLALLAVGATHAAVAPFRGWEQVKETSPKFSVSAHQLRTQRHHIRVALKQNNLDVLEKILEEVSLPSSPAYGQYITRDEITALVSLEKNELNMVLQAFECGEINGTTTGVVQCALSVHQDYLDVTAPVSVFERLFQTEMSVFTPSAHAIRMANYRDAKQRERYSQWAILRSTSAATLPAAVHGLVRFVQGVDDFPALSPSRVHAVKSARSFGFQTGDPGINVDPNVLRTLYKIQNANATCATSYPAASRKGSISCAEFEGEQFGQNDIDAFTSAYKIPQQNVIVEGVNSGGYHGEGTLDLEYLIGVAPGVPVTWWGMKWVEFGHDLLQWAIDVQTTTNPPLVHSISWGSSEADSASYNRTQMDAFNTELIKMGTQGLSVFAASGDEGTGAGGWFCSSFDPNWPATSPFLTAVGGTYVSTAPTASGDAKNEVGWADSGGGFSTIYPMPAWQKNAVNVYLAQKPADFPAASFYNSSNRAIPDVSAAAVNYQVITAGGGAASESGTSASTPVFAALIALVNDARLAAGKPSLGFVNPALYQIKGGVGSDIITGNNKNPSCSTGYPALPGWDAITGLGTPLYETLMTLVDV